MAYPPPGSPMMGFRPPVGVPPFAMPPPQPGMMPMGMPLPMGPGVRLPLQPPPMQPMGVPMYHSPIKTTFSSPPVSTDLKPLQTKVPVVPASEMKVATTVFVGNISDKASDTLVRQILLRCGRIEGWKRVQDASGKLQAFGFCEYADPESTLRALRLLHSFKLGEKSLVVKVDGKTRKDLLKYLMRKKRAVQNLPMDDDTIEKEVADIEEKEKDQGSSVLTQDMDDDSKTEDTRVMNAINSLVKENIEVLTSTKTSEDAQLEQDVKDALFSMAKQSGKIDPDSTLDDVDMEDDMKTLVSDEIKRFRQSYQRDEEQKVVRKARERERRERDRERTRDRERDKERERTKEKKEEREKEKAESERDKKDRGDKKSSRERSRSPRRDQDRDVRRSPRKERSRSPKHRSPSRSSSPRSRSQEWERRRERDRQRERDESLREEEEYEERIRGRRQRERDKAYRERLAAWETRERRKANEYGKEFEKEGDRRKEMDREKRHLAEFLEDYDDERDDQRYYKGSAYGRRRRERELEQEDDERDRLRAREEMETLQLEVMERQAREKIVQQQLREEEARKEQSRESSLGESSPERQREKEEEGEDEDMEVPEPEVKEEEEDIPLIKAGYTLPSTYPPIQVQAAPAVQPPEIKDHPREKTIGEGITIRTFEPLKPEEVVKREEEEKPDSPQAAPKLVFGLKKSSSSAGGTTLPPAKKTKLESVFNAKDDEAEERPRRKLVPIDYSEEEQATVRDGEERKPSEDKRNKSDTSSKKVPAEERKKMIQNLVNSIPTTKEGVFSYELKWDAIDKSLMDKRVGPWINKKIVEYIGEEEPTLTDFICNKLACHIPAEEILKDIAMVLDDEAEVFIVKLWRLLIYETEAKHLGIAKNY